MSDSGETPSPQSVSLMRSRLLFLVPLGLFLALALFLGLGLRLGDPGELPSALIGAPAPEFDLPPIEGAPPGLPGLAKSDLTTGEVVLVNVWASWCGPCRYEHSLLMEISETTNIPIYGLNNKDKASDALRFLGSLGNPYSRIGADITGRVSIDFGVYGVPETYVINGRGEILLRHVGPINDPGSPGSQKTVWLEKILPVIQAAREAKSE